METEIIPLGDCCAASVKRPASQPASLVLSGLYAMRCLGADGKIKWEDTFGNVVTTVGKNHMLDNDLQTSVAIVGPFLGLISSVGYGAGPVIGDTMAAHAGWNEAGSGANFPLYTAPRKTAVWNAASGGVKAFTARLDFPIITTGGTVKGSFLVYGAGALSTIADAGGTLFSAGVFSGGDKLVDVGDTLQVAYSATLS